MKRAIAFGCAACAALALAAVAPREWFAMDERKLVETLKTSTRDDERVAACQELSHRGGAVAAAELDKLLAGELPPAVRAAAEGARAAIPLPDARARAAAGDATAIKGLFDGSLGEGREALVARRLLVGFPAGGAAAKFLAAELDGEDAKRARQAASLLGERQEKGAFAPLVARAEREGTPPALRNACWNAIGATCDAGDLPRLCDVLKRHPGDERLSGAVVRALAKGFARPAVAVEIVEAKYGFFPSNRVADVRNTLAAICASGAREVMASSRLSGPGGFVLDPAPGFEKELVATYRINGGEPQTVRVPEGQTVVFSPLTLPEEDALAIGEAYAAAETPALKAALVKVVEALRRRGRVPGLEELGFRPLFNGKDLTGWAQEDGFWSVRDGVLTGESTAERPCRPNHHLVYVAEPLGDFTLRARFRLSPGSNSGVQIRCAKQFVGDEGYQADMNGNGNYVGYLYHPRQHLVGERGADVAIAADGRKTVTRFADGDELRKLYRAGDWNDLEVEAKGRTVTVWINGARTTSVTDARAEFLPEKGAIALQLHQGPPMKVEFKDVRVRNP